MNQLVSKTSWPTGLWILGKLPPIKDKGIGKIFENLKKRSVSNENNDYDDSNVFGILPQPPLSTPDLPNFPAPYFPNLLTVSDMSANNDDDDNDDDDFDNAKNYSSNNFG